MKKTEAAAAAACVLWNRAKGWPICVSFEVTHSCLADCRHCDKGGIKTEAKLMAPEDYRVYSKVLKPGVCQISGGEPLLRDDLEDVIRNVKRTKHLPAVICVSNAWLMTERRYLSLIEAGVSLFSHSLDFPDERHDEFRRVPGLFAKMDELLPYLMRKYARNDIVLNAALTRENFAEIPGLVARAEKWGTRISFSAYSSLRTGDRSLCIEAPDDLKLLRENMGFLKAYRRRSSTVLNSEYILDQTYRFFAEGGMGGCRAGQRFLVVRPDGLINACSMFPELRYGTRKEAAEGFESTRKSCDQCYVSIRASTERSLGRTISETLALRLI